MNNYKKQYKKVKILFAIIASICTILSFILSFFSSPKTLTDDKKTIKNVSKKSNTYNIDGDNNIIIQGNNTGSINLDEDTSSDFIHSQEHETPESKDVPRINFGQAIQHIHKNEIRIKKKIIENKKSKPTYSSVYPGVCYSKISYKIRLIEVTRGFRGFKCSRIYHFDKNNKLTFALVKDDEGEHRLYFYNNTIIRYIDINGKIHDINYDLEKNECKWTELALKESYEIFNGV